MNLFLTAEIECDDPGSLENGDIQGEDFTFGSEISYVCNENHVLIGDDTRSCTENGWSGEAPQCEGM